MSDRPIDCVYFLIVSASDTKGRAEIRKYYDNVRKETDRIREQSDHLRECAEVARIRNQMEEDRQWSVSARKMSTKDTTPSTV